MDEVINEEALDDILPSDSLSQIIEHSPISATGNYDTRNSTLEEPKDPIPFTQSEVNRLLGNFSRREIREARIRILNYGYDLRNIAQPIPKIRKAPRSPLPPLSRRQLFLDAFRGDRAKARERVRFEEEEAELLAKEQEDHARLVRQQADYDAEVLHCTARYCDVIAALLVLQKGVHINTQVLRADVSFKTQVLFEPMRRTLIGSAILGTKSDAKILLMVQTLVQIGGDYQSPGSCFPKWKVEYSNLYLAILGNQTKTAEFLVNLGVNIMYLNHHTQDLDLPDRRNVTALHAAARGLHASTVKLLLDRGAEVNAAYFVQATGAYTTPLNGCYKNDDKEK